MEYFLYQVIKKELEKNIEISLFLVNNKHEIMIEKKEIPYCIFISKNDLKHLKINEEDIRICEKIFYDKNKEEVVKLLINNLEAYKETIDEIRTNSFKTYEQDILPEHRYLIDNPIENHLIELKYLSIDIETIGMGEGIEIVSISIHSPTNSNENRVYINTSEISDKLTREINNSKFKKFKVEMFENEKDLLSKFQEDIIKSKPQIILGWNLIDFDFKVIKARMDYYSIDFKFNTYEGEFKIRINNDFFKDSTLFGPGMLFFDVISLLKTNFINFEDFKLNTVSKEVLDDEKIDIEEDELEENKIEAINKMYRENPLKLIEYNFKDSELTSKIVEKLNLIKLMQQRSIITKTPLSKVKSPIASLDIMYLEKLHEKNLVADSNFVFSNTEPIGGAHVISPQKGFYEDVYVFDFKSLYPSIIMTFNIDPFSYSKEGQIKAPNGAKFEKNEAILPSLIRNLYFERDKAKKENDSVKSFAIKTTMNSFYGAIASPKCRFYSKDVGEAITSFGREILQRAKAFVEEKGHRATYGDSVTGDTKIIVRKGINGKIQEINIEDLFSYNGKETQVKQKDNSIKSYKKISNIYTLTMNDSFENVWKPLEYAVKHKSNKRIYKIWINNQQSVKVTEDHSLIKYDFYGGLSSISPKEAKRIIYNYGFDVKSKRKENYLFTFLGFWIGDGHLEKNGCNVRIAAGKDSEEFIKKVLQNISEIKKSKIYKKPKGDLDFSNKKFYYKIEKMGFLRDWTSQTKRIPESIFKSDLDSKLSFLKGIFSSDGTIIRRNKLNIIRYTSINKFLIEDLNRLLMSVGIGSTYFRENKTNKYLGKDSKTYSYHLVINSQKHEYFMRNVGFIFERKNSKFQTNKKLTKKITVKHIKKKEELPQKNNYVYDLSVKDTQKFYGNSVLLKNTDSIFVEMNLGKKSFEEKKNVGFEFEKEMNKHFEEWVVKEYGMKNYLNIEFEKLYTKFFIASKKRYVGYDGISKQNIFVGMEAIRGDWTELAKNFQRELIDLIFSNKSKEDIEKFILSYVSKLKDGKFDDLLTYRKKITKPLSEYTKTTPPHVKAAREVEGFKGRTVYYIMTKEGPKHISLLLKDIEFDYDHYIEKQLGGVSDDILGSIGIDFKDVLYKKKQKKLESFF